MTYRFGTYSLDTDRLELRSGDALVPVEPQVFSLIAYLVQNRERVVSKDEIVHHIWKNRAVSDATLNSRINSARRALGDNGKEQGVIRTYARRGFRFVASVEKTHRVRAQTDREAESAVAPALPSIAVLAFVNLGDDPANEYFSDGISEDIITELSKISGLFVIARRSSFAYKGRGAHARQVANELGVRYLLEGSVRRSGPAVRINAQLIDGRSGRQIWAERYNGDVGDLFAFQDRIIEQIVSATATVLTRAEQSRALRAAPGDLNAYDMLLRGVYFHHRYTKEDNEKAKRLFERAIEIDADYAEAYACLAWAFVHDFNFGWSNNPDEALLRATELAEKAVEMDGASAKAHMVLGDAYIWLGRVRDAYAEGKRAVELSPNSADANFLFAWYAAWAGKVDEAIAGATKALRLDHNAAFFGYHFVLGHALFLAERFAEAAEHIERAVRLKPNVWFPRWWLIATYGHLKRPKDARPHIAAVACLRALPVGVVTSGSGLLPEPMRYENPAHRQILLSGLFASGDLDSENHARKSTR